MKNRNRTENKVFQLVIIVAAACLIHGVMQGVHDNYGIMMNSLISITGTDYASVSFCIGAGALIYGFAQPFLGMLALKRSNTFVIMLGIVFTVLGLIITPLCRNFFSLFLSFGLILPFGTTGLCFGIVMGAITPVLGEKRAALVSGIVQASAGIGDALMSPGLEALISRFGIRTAMNTLALPFLIMIPLVVWIASKNKSSAETVQQDSYKHISLFTILKDAFRDRDYRLILIGFATCGFNMSIIESHLFSQFLSYGIAGSTASLTLTVYGIATMVGAAGAGFLGVKYRMKNVLGCVYAIRVLISLGFLFLPKSVPFAFAATALLGLSGDATVPPTSGIVSRKFGAERMSVIYGFALIGHQAGAFLSSYLGGLLVREGLGYAPLWIINMCLAAIAAAGSFSIRKDTAY